MRVMEENYTQLPFSILIPFQPLRRSRVLDPLTGALIFESSYYCLESSSSLLLCLDYRLGWQAGHVWRSFHCSAKYLASSYLFTDLAISLRFHFLPLNLVFVSHSRANEHFQVSSWFR